MPLTRASEVYLPNRFNAVNFWMRHSDNVEGNILCKVSYEALRDLADNDGAGWDTNKTFEAHRDQIEVIASAKYDRGQFASGDGDQAKIVISTDELNG
jgi:hypothetical protein